MAIVVNLYENASYKMLMFSKLNKFVKALNSELDPCMFDVIAVHEGVVDKFLSE